MQVFPLKAKGLAAALVFAPLVAVGARGDALDRAVPRTLTDEHATGTKTEMAVLAGGCFWGMQAVFEHVRGVRKVVAGYAGGHKETATYDQVSTETTGHAESVQITFDPAQVSFGTLLQIYFSVAHDPTEIDRQGPDEGTSYRSEIFAESAEQARIARGYISQLDSSRVFAQPIATRVEPLRGFFPAEAYHQDFLITHRFHPYILINDLPKLSALKRVFPASYLENPTKLATSGP